LRYAAARNRSPPAEYRAQRPQQPAG